MGISKALFFDGDFGTRCFSEWLYPSVWQTNEQFRISSHFSNWVKGRAEQATGLDVTMSPQGSVLLGTQVKPLGKNDKLDIDLGVHFSLPDRESISRHSPVILKNAIHQLVCKYLEACVPKGEASCIRKQHCSRVEYKSGISLDVPAYLYDRTVRLSFLASDSGCWEDRDPQVFKRWILDQIQPSDHAKFKRLVRYVKAWAGLKVRDKTGKPTSFPLTVLTTVAVCKDYSLLNLDDDDALASAFIGISQLIAQAARFPNPINSNEDLFCGLSDGLIAKLQREVSSAALISHRAAIADTVENAKTSWAQLLGPFFAVRGVCGEQ